MAGLSLLFREELGIVLLALLCVPSLVAEQAMHGGATTRSGLAWIYHDGVVYRQTADEDAVCVRACALAMA